jgi:hypothetical protein
MAKWKLLSKHEWEFGSALPGYGKAGCAFLAGLAVTAGGIALIVFNFGGDAGIGPVLLGVGLTLLGLLPLAAGAILWPWQWIAWVKVYEQGLRWKAGGREHERHWDEVKRASSSEIQAIDVHGHRNEWYSSASLVLHFADGTMVTFDTALSDYGKMVRTVREARQRAAAAAPE